MRSKFDLNRRGQVWIETVLYTLIGLALIGVVLAVALPRINASKDKILVEQTIEALSVFDGKINEVVITGPGNSRAISPFSMKRGELYFNSSSDKIIFVLTDLNVLYSESGKEIEIGKLKVLSIEGNNEKTHSTTLTLDYADVANITFKEKEDTVKFSAAAVPYSFVIENQGVKNNSALYVVDITEVSRG